MAQAKEATRPHLFDVHPGVAMAQKWVAELKGKTGRSLEEWIALAKKDRITHRIAIESVDEIDAEVKKWLKTAYELDAEEK
jgi:hypothetical protein